MHVAINEERPAVSPPLYIYVGEYTCAWSWIEETQNNQYDGEADLNRDPLLNWLPW